MSATQFATDPTVQATGPRIAAITAGLDPDFVPYEQGLALQQSAFEGVSSERNRGTLLLLEHTSVYTAGRRSDQSDFPTDGTPVVPVDRGGKVTWHGPGQLVAYPIIKLRKRVGVVDFVRALEQALIDVSAAVGVTGHRVEGRSGVWADVGDPQPAKFAQIGIHVSRGIVTHGIAINCSNSLDPFGNFVPCGITDAGVTTLSQIAGRLIRPAEVAPLLEKRFISMLEEVAE